MREPSPEVDALAKMVIESATEVHTILGAGFLESTYEQALAIELSLRGIPFQRQWPIVLHYKGEPVGEARLDFLVGGLLIVELKAVESLHPVHHAQVINYLRATKFQLGLLMNFNVEHLKDGIKRVVFT